MQNRMLTFINQYNLIFFHQHSFREIFLANFTIIDLFNELTQSIDRDLNLNTAGCFIDVCKAFNMPSHSILMSKLFHLSFCGVRYKWVNNYSPCLSFMNRLNVSRLVYII